MPTPEESRQAGFRMVVIFALGSEMFAVEAAAVQEITLMARLSVPGRLPSVLAGFLNLAGRPVPIVQLHRLLGLPQPGPALYAQIVILKEGPDGSVGWMVDRVAHVGRIPEAKIMPVPEKESFRDCAMGVFTFSNTPVCLLAPDRVLLEKEERCVAEFREMEQERLREMELSGS